MSEFHINMNSFVRRYGSFESSRQKLYRVLFVRSLRMGDLLRPWFVEYVCQCQIQSKCVQYLHCITYFAILSPHAPHALAQAWVCSSFVS